MDRACLDRGVEIADVLSGSWRSSVPDLRMPAERLRPLLPLLLRSGSAGLAWRRLERSALGTSPESNTFRNVYILNAAHASKQRLQVAELFGRLRKRGIEALLLKGCAVANLYPSPGLRPPGDIDVLVSPSQRRVAEDICHRFWVDLDHDVFIRFGERNFSMLFAHSDVIDIAGCPVHTLGQEDQLSFLSLHFLKHGAIRPGWLCDIAAAIETRRSTFDWNRCYGNHSKRAEWIACTVLLAERLLGADLGKAAFPTKRTSLPRWFETAVLKQWGACQVLNLPLLEIQIVKEGFKRTIRSSVSRWPNPIQATIDCNAPIDWKPRLPFQLRNFISRTWHFANRRARGHLAQHCQTKSSTTAPRESVSSTHGEGLLQIGVE